MPTIYTTDTTSSGYATSGSSAETLDSNLCINAANVICNNNYQFVTLAEKQALQNVLEIMGNGVKNAMFQETYDKNKDGIVDLAQEANVAHSIEWSDIVNRPNIPVSDIETLSENSHAHTNKALLDSLGQDENGFLTLNNSTPVDLSSFMLIGNFDLDQDGTIDRANYAESVDWTGIMNKPITFTPSSHTHTASEIYGGFEASTLNGLTSDDFLKKDDTITLSQISDLDDLSISMVSLNGGNSSSTFDHILNNETRVQIRSDSKQYWNVNNPTLALAEQAYEYDTKRFKIGDGIHTYNSIAYNYNTPESIRFQIAASKYITKYYDYAEKPVATAETIETDMLEPGYTELYHDTVKGSNGSYYGIPFHANNVLCADSTCQTIGLFGTTEITTLNEEGAGWFSGVAYKNYIYCAPYNAIKILVIDTENRLIDSINYTGSDIYAVKKYTKGVYCPVNNRIYFAPYSSKAILELNPEDNSINFYGEESMFSSEENFCDVVFNPLDEKLYFIPVYGNKILRLDPLTMQIKEVATLRDNNRVKFNAGVLAPNGLIYCIPGFGYDYIAAFDPNIYDIDYYDLECDMYDEFSPVVTPSNKIFLIPNGATNNNIITYDIETNTTESIYTMSSSQDRWSGAVYTAEGLITSLPSTSNKVLRIDTKLKAPIDADVLEYFSK